MRIFVWLLALAFGPWHRIPNATAVDVCEELRAGGVAGRCTYDSNDRHLAVFPIVGGPATAKGTLIAFSSREHLARWISSPQTRDQPIYHASKGDHPVGVIFAGDVRAEIKAATVEALDAL